MFLSKLDKQKTGFTLVELLVVVAILGILSTFSVVNLNLAKAKARDAKRLSDIVQIRKALEIYNYSEGIYPGAGLCDGLSSIATCLGTNWNNNWVPSLDTLTGINALPIDPTSDTIDEKHFYYLYQVVDALPTNHYLLMYNLETKPRTSTCNGEGFSDLFSCVSIGVE